MNRHYDQMRAHERDLRRNGVVFLRTAELYARDVHSEIASRVFCSRRGNKSVNRNMSKIAVKQPAE